MKKLTLGLCIVSTTTALAHDLEYRVCKGDTLSAIARKFHVSGKSILHANDLTADHHMRPGGQLLIPGVESRSAKSAGHSYSGSSYVVRNGDQDWSLAMKHGISVHKLHLANPGVDWDHLKIGIPIHFPGGAGLNTSKTSIVAHSSHSGRNIHTASTKGIHMHAHWHLVEPGENDWIIAHKAGIRLTLLKGLNPEINVSNLKVGQKVRVPGSSVARLVALKVPHIRSTHVAVSGDNVTIRTKPGVGAESICTVDQGTRAAVLDRDGNWYQLKFPKGTVGWVRGDLLKAVHVIEVAQVEKRHHYAVAPASHHQTYTAQSHRSHHEQPHHYVAVAHHEQSHHYVAVAKHHHASHNAPAEHTSSSEYTAMDTDSGEADGVLTAAKSMRGVRYRWGAASRGATDCSGFTKQVMASNGIHLPRVSREQAQVGSHVGYNEMKPGDLVFFSTGRGHRITHVGIYEGNGRFIHASSGGGHVQENSLNEGYYHKRLATVRRVLKHKHKTNSETVAKVDETPKSSESEKKPEVETNPGLSDPGTEKGSE